MRKPVPDGEAGTGEAVKGWRGFLNGLSPRGKGGGQRWGLDVASPADHDQITYLVRDCSAPWKSGALLFFEWLPGMAP
jgi:hypothetical protein